MPLNERPKPVEFRPPSKKTIVIVIIAVIAFFVITSLKSVATFYTDSLLFSSLGQGSTFKKLLGARLFVPTVAFVVMTISVALTIFLATHFGRKNSLATTFDEWIIPLARVYKSKTALIRNVLAIAFGALFASSTVGRYKEWILFQNSQTVGTKDPLFKKDIGFYLFELPFIRLALSWTFGGLVVLILVAFCAHYINGSIRLERAARHVSVAAKVHLSVLCAIAGFVKSAQYYFDRFALVHSTRGAVDGATYTDVNAQLPATRLLIFVAVIASILFLVNVYRKGVVLPLVAIALWLIVSLVIGNVYPLVVQTFVVKPSRNTKEKSFTQRNIRATRTAYGLNDVESTDVAFTQGITKETAPDVKAVLKNSLLWNESSLDPWFQQKRGEQIYEFKASDRDRYKVDGKIIPAFVAARELVASDSLPDTSWQSRHATYSHGFGAVISSGSSVITGNEPDYLVSDLPSESKSAPVEGLDLSSAKARLYFGEGLEDFVFVGSTKSEQTPTNDKIDVSDLGGVRINNPIKKAAFALRFGDYNILIADAVTDKSKIVYERDPGARVKKIAPFLDIDSNPYPVVTNGEVVWVVDAYTSSDQYPYSQYVSTDNLYANNVLKKKLNYVRNSVKATVNARTGKVTLFVVDSKDPLIKAYSQAFPKLFTDVSKAPQEIVDHFRYPEDLFNVQTEVYADYHITDPTVLLKGSQRWQPAPGGTASADVVTSNSVVTTVQGGRADKAKSTGGQLPPLYQYIQHTAMTSPQFVLTRAFVPIRSSFKMDSFLSVSSDGSDYGKMRLISFDADPDTSALSPTQMVGQINTDKEYSQEVTLLDQRGSIVLSGPLQIIPVANTVVYVQPIYVQGNTKDSRPVLTYVTVSVSGRTVCAPSIDEAIDALVSGTSLCVPFTQNVGTGSATPAPTPTPTTPVPTPTPSDPNDLSALSDAQLVSRLAAAGDAYEKAKNPLDLGALQKAADEMVRLSAELNKRGGS